MPQLIPTHYIIKNLGESQQFIIPGRKIWYVIATTGFGAMIWTAGSVILTFFLPAMFNSIFNLAGAEEVGVLQLIIAGVILATLLFWAFLGVFIVRMFLWHIGGMEIIEVTPQSIRVRRQIFNVGRSSIYPAKRIRNLRFAPPSKAPDLPGSAVDPYGISLTIDRLAFEYETKTIWFARGLDGAEAKHLLDTIKQHLVQGAS